jgi:prepilin-type N-terminal cleavage/methylation domain-containing protein
MSKKTKKAFTLIEVMVAVMIISVVVMALLSMQGNTTHIFSRLNKTTTINQFTTFLISNKQYGFSKEDVYLNDLLSDFKVEDNLRRRFKNTKLELSYIKLQSFNDKSDTDDKSNSDNIIEIGKSTIKTENLTTSFVRLNLK